MSENNNRDVKNLTDYIKNANDPKDVIRVLDHIAQCFEEGDDFFFNFEKFSETIEVVWFKLNQNSNGNNEFVQKIDTFFKNMIRGFTSRLQGDDFSTETLKILNLIFSPKPANYRDYRYHQDLNDDIQSKLSSYEANHFVSDGSLGLMINKIRDSKFSFENLKKMVNTIKKVSKKVDKIEVGMTEELLKIVFHKILGSTDEEFKNENKKDLDLIVKHLSGIVNNLQYEHTNDFLEYIHQQSLLVSLKCFKSPSLFQRNAGLNDIIRFCKLENNNNNSNFMIRNQPISFYVPPTKIVEWIKENQVVELLYGETSHIQLLQKCTDILKFLAEQKSFDRKYLDLIWSASEGKHETIENAIYETIGTIAPLLPPEDIDYLFEKVQMIPYSDYTQTTLSLVRSLTQRSSSSSSSSNTITTCSNNNNNNSNNGGSSSDVASGVSTTTGSPPTTITTPIIHNSKGLDIFWNLIQESCPVSFELAEAALNWLQESFYYYPQQRTEYLTKCLNRIENHNSVILCLRLLYFIITSLAERRKKRENNNMMNSNNNNNNIDVEYIASVIESIDKQYHLIDLIFNHLIFYNQQCKQTLAERLASVDANGNSTLVSTINTGPIKNAAGYKANCDDVVFAAGINHISQTYDYLNFIQFAYDKSSLTLTEHHIDIFWDVFVLEPVSNADRTHFFNWIQDHMRFNEEQYLYFMNKFQTITFSNIGIDSFGFYTYCINSIKQQQQLHHHHSGSGNHHQQQQDIVSTIGLDYLWRILLEAQNVEVGKAACLMLIEQYKDFKNPEEFLNTCMAKLSKVPINNGGGSEVCFDQANYILVTRCLSLVKKYLEEFGSRFSDSFKRHFSPLITVQFNGTKNRFRLDVKSSESIGNLKSIVSNKIRSIQQQQFNYQQQQAAAGQPIGGGATIGQPSLLMSISPPAPQNIVITYQGKVLSDDYSTLEDFRISNGDVVTFQEIGEPRSIDVNYQTISFNFDQSNFSLLFGLLNIQSIAQDVWDLLMLLPVNKEILNQVTNEITNYNLNNNGTSTGGPPINWNLLFDSKSSYRLLYSLLIIESLVITNGDNGGGEESNNSQLTEWKQKFILLGGSNHLIQVLMTTDLQSSSRGNKRNTCLSVLLRIIFNILEIGQFNFTSSSPIPINNILPIDLLNRLISLTWNQVLPTCKEENYSIHETEDAMVISHCIRLIVAILGGSSTLFDQFSKNKDILKWISLIVLESKDTFIRDKAANGIREICHSISPDKSKPYFLKQFLTLLFDTVANDRYSTSCQQFFEVLCFLLNDSCSSFNISCQFASNGGSDSGGMTVDQHTLLNEKQMYSELLLRLVEMIKTHPIVESTTIYQADTLLMGLLNLVKILIQDNQEFKLLAGQQGGLVSEIFHQCLFNIATAEAHGPTSPPKCKTKESRDCCFAVLLELSKGCPENLREITELLMDHHKPEEKRNLWSYYPAGNEKSTCGYVGLKNLGATCYINSLMQQLFMIPGFRYNIIQSEDKYNSPQEQQESLLYQLKIIFANLQESEKKSHDPKEFCLAYKYDGQPINTSVQMDADEFFNMLFDKLENTLKATPQEKLLKDFFGGSSVNQFISQECNHVSEREEPFYTISVEVKNKKEIQESLQLFVESETLDGDNKYFCSSCSQKVKALMRRCIKDLPNTLIIHNKRFEFDLDLMKRTKLNDALRFPMTIDMEPYTKEYLERKEAIEKAKEKNEPIPEIPSIHPSSYYQYELAGILVHTGTADSGHYYSYIKEREPISEGQPRRWILFNDQATEVFNPEDISKACFGGYDHDQNNNGKSGGSSNQSNSSSFRSGPRVNNAYMLFYERTFIQGEMTKKYESVKPSQASQLVPKDMFSSVWKKNMKFLNDKNIFDGNYFSFIQSIIKLDDENNVYGINGIDSGNGNNATVDNNRMDFISSQELLKSENATGSSNKNNINLIDESSSTNAIAGDEIAVGGGDEGTSMLVSNLDGGNFNQTMQSIELGTRFVIETLFHSKDRKVLNDTVNYLISLYERNPDACYWLLNTMVQQSPDQSWVKQIFLTCITFDPREALMKLLLAVIKVLIPRERELYDQFEDDDEIGCGGNGGGDSDIDIDVDQQSNHMMSDDTKPSSSNSSGRTITATSVVDDDEDFNMVSIIQKQQQQSSSVGIKQKATSQMVLEDDIYSTTTSKRPKSIIFKFMDCYLDFIKEAPMYWKHFAHYFTFIREFANLGQEERKYLVGRNVIGRLIDFFLGDESPISKHPPQKKFKMGDKYTTPQFLNTIEVINILVHSCHTKYSVGWLDNQGGYSPNAPLVLNQCVPSDQLIEMPDDDMDLLYNPIFVAKAIKDQVLTKSTTDIISYICFNDIDTTSSVINHLEGIDQGKTSLDVLLPLISLNDQFKEQRIDIAIPQYIQILEDNFKSRGSLPFLKYLIEAAVANDFISFWFEANFDRWVASWLIGSEQSEVRVEAYTLLVHIGQLNSEQFNVESVMNLFSFICTSDIIKYAKKICKKDKDHRGIFKFEYYFKLLRMCVQLVPQCKKMFTQQATLFYGFISDIIFQQNEIDRNRQELVSFLVEALRGEPENIALLQKEQCSMKLMDYFISISNRDDLKQFNQKSLPAFYELLYILGSDKQQFLEYVIGHGNFEWACKFLLCECGEYQEITVQLFKLLELVHKVPKFAPQLILHFIQFPNFFFYPTNAIRLMDTLMFSRKEAISFVNAQGIFIMSKFLGSSKDRDTVEQIKVIDLLYKILTLIRSNPVVAVLSPSSSQGAVGENASGSPKSNSGGVIVIDDQDTSSSSSSSPSSSSGGQTLQIDTNILTGEVKQLSTVLFNLMDNCESVCTKASKLLNLIALESPEITINAFNDYVTKWIGKKTSFFNNLANSNNSVGSVGMNSINLVDSSDPRSHQQFTHGNPMQSYPQSFVGSGGNNNNSSPTQLQQPVGSSQRQIQNLLNQFSFSESFFNSMVDIVLMSMHALPNQTDSKASISLGKLVKEVFTVNIEFGSRILNRVINNLKNEERISLVVYCIENNYIGVPYEHQSTTAAVGSQPPLALVELYRLIKTFLQDKSNEEIVNNICTDLEDRVTTAIVSIQSLENFNDNEIDTHLSTLTNALAQIQLLDHCCSTDKSRQSLNNTIAPLKEFAKKDCCNIQTENAKLFLSNFSNLSIRSSN